MLYQITSKTKTNIVLQALGPLEQKISITTVLQEHPIRQMTILPIFEEINDQRKLPFLLFNFNHFSIFRLIHWHEHSDPTSGSNHTPTVEIPLLIEPNRSSEIYEIEEETKSLIKIPVSVKEGPFLCDHIQFEPDFS